MGRHVYTLPIPVTTQSKAWVCGRSLARIVGLNPTRGTDVCLLRVLCVVRWRFLCRAGHYSRVLPSVLRRNECDNESSITRWPWATVEPWGGKKSLYFRSSNCSFLHYIKQQRSNCISLSQTFVNFKFRGQMFTNFNLSTYFII